MARKTNKTSSSKPVISIAQAVQQDAQAPQVKHQISVSPEDVAGAIDYVEKHLVNLSSTVAEVETFNFHKDTLKQAGVETLEEALVYMENFKQPEPEPTMPATLVVEQLVQCPTCNKEMSAKKLAKHSTNCAALTAKRLEKKQALDAHNNKVTEDIRQQVAMSKAPVPELSSVLKGHPFGQRIVDAELVEHVIATNAELTPLEEVHKKLAQLKAEVAQSTTEIQRRDEESRQWQRTVYAQAQAIAMQAQKDLKDLDEYLVARAENAALIKMEPVNSEAMSDLRQELLVFIEQQDILTVDKHYIWYTKRGLGSKPVVVNTPKKVAVVQVSKEEQLDKFLGNKLYSTVKQDLPVMTRLELWAKGAFDHKASEQSAVESTAKQLDKELEGYGLHVEESKRIILIQKIVEAGRVRSEKASQKELYAKKS